jgi:hypothetical protein
VDIISRVGHPMPYSVELLVMNGMLTISEAPILYYKFFEITPTLSKRG